MSTCSSTNLSLGGQTLRNVVLEAAEHDVSTTLDVKGILWTEHINLVVGSKELAEYFYLNFLGFTRDAGKSFHVNLRPTAISPWQKTVNQLNASREA